VKSWATLGGLIAVVLAVVGYPTIEDLLRNQVCEALRGAEECYLERLVERRKELEQYIEELDRKYGFRNGDGRDGDRYWWSEEFHPMPIPPTHPPDDRPIDL
jgi:hypothetical protein